jgi:anti-sigma-K factor RskA
MTDSDSFDLSVPDPWGNLPAYALNALNPEERARVEALLEVSPEAREELRLYQDMAEKLSHLATQAGSIPSERVRASLLAQADSDIHLIDLAREEARSVRPSRVAALSGFFRSFRAAYVGTAAVSVSVLGIALFFGIENSRLGSEVAQLRMDREADLAQVADLRQAMDEASVEFDVQQAEVARLNAVNDGLNEALKNQQWLTYVTQNREFRVPNYFVGGPGAPEANGTLAVKNFDDLAVFLVSGLPPAPDGFQYGLTLMRDGVPEQVATFQVNQAGQARVEFDLPDNISQFESAMVVLNPVDPSNGTVSGLEVMQVSQTNR